MMIQFFALRILASDDPAPQAAWRRRRLGRQPRPRPRVAPRRVTGIAVLVGALVAALRVPHRLTTRVKGEAAPAVD
jgi:hypothetical protein